MPDNPWGYLLVDQDLSHDATSKLKENVIHIVYCLGSSSISSNIWPKKVMWQRLAMDTMALCLMLIDCGLIPGQSLFGGFQCSGPPPPSKHTVWSIDQRGDMTMKKEHEDE